MKPTVVKKKRIRKPPEPLLTSEEISVLYPNPYGHEYIKDKTPRRTIAEMFADGERRRATLHALTYKSQMGRRQYREQMERRRAKKLGLNKMTWLAATG